MKLNKDKVFALVAEKGWRLKDLSEISQVSIQTVSKFLNEKKYTCNPLTVGKIAKALGVSVEDIIVKEGD